VTQEPEEAVAALDRLLVVEGVRGE
jgi:hypothetical protein